MIRAFEMVLPGHRDKCCERVGDPTRWSHHVNDQAIVIG